VGIKAYDDADSTLLANKLAEAQKEGTLSTASLGQTVPSMFMCLTVDGHAAHPMTSALLLLVCI